MDDDDDDRRRVRGRCCSVGESYVELSSGMVVRFILERSLRVCRVGGFGTRQLRHRVLNQKYSIISRTMYKTYYFRDEASK